MKKGEAGTYLGILLSGTVDIMDENTVIVTSTQFPRGVVRGDSRFT
jgi:hypothetical protein